MKIKNDKGFTLPELMTVMLIIAVLMSIAVPIFIQARNRAVVRSCQERLSTVVKVAQNLNSGGNSEGVSENMHGIEYASMTAVMLDAELDSVDVIATVPGTGSKEVQLVTSNPFVLRARDANGDLHTATIDNSTGAVAYN